jgi:hypothetical protein
MLSNSSSPAQTTFDKNKYQELQDCYEIAVKDNKESFVFYSETLLTSYAKYLLEYLKPLVS